ncbi:MAG: ArsR family transcriptional regulator [Proteobacteria bacterium]|nr:ArsR family transcriptional regulator [Pseudomonadota bacterium]
MQALDESALTHVATYFRALSEPTRLRILNTLREGEKNVSQITEKTGCGQANVSKHLALLFEAGLVTRTSQGTAVFYGIADAATFELCDIVCGNVARIVERQFASANALKKQLGKIGKA